MRPQQGRYVAGVCAAIGRATNTDPTLWRVIFAVLTLAGGISIVAYLLGWLLLPAEGDTGSPLEALLGRGRSTTSAPLAIVIGVGAVLAFLLVMSRNVGPAAVGLAVVIGVVALLVRGQGNLQAAPQGDQPGGGGPGTPSGRSCRHRPRRDAVPAVGAAVPGRLRRRSRRPAPGGRGATRTPGVAATPDGRDATRGPPHTAAAGHAPLVPPLPPLPPLAPVGYRPPFAPHGPFGGRSPYAASLGYPPGAPGSPYPGLVPPAETPEAAEGAVPPRPGDLLADLSCRWACSPRSR